MLSYGANGHIKLVSVVKADAMTKSTLFLLDAEDQLASMKLAENDDPKVHLMEVKQHFQLMGQ